MRNPFKCIRGVSISASLGDTAPTYLETEDLEKWENAFETIYVTQLDILNDQVLRARMGIVLAKSQHCDISLLRSALYYISCMTLVNVKQIVCLTT